MPPKKKKKKNPVLGAFTILAALGNVGRIFRVDDLQPKVISVFIWGKLQMFRNELSTFF